MENIKERFIDIEGKNIFTRINPLHLIDLYIGHDEEGRYAIKYRGNFKPEKGIKSVAGIAVNQYCNDEFNTLQFSLMYSDNQELFFTFCQDIIETTKSISDNRSAYKTILNRYYSWKKMFSTPRKILSESEIMGLIGELLFMRDFLFEKYGCAKAKIIQVYSNKRVSNRSHCNRLWLFRLCFSMRLSIATLVKATGVYFRN